MEETKMFKEPNQKVSEGVARIKEVVSAIRGATGQIDYDIVLSKVLRTFLPIYAIRMSTI